MMLWPSRRAHDRNSRRSTPCWRALLLVLLVLLLFTVVVLLELVVLVLVVLVLLRAPLQEAGPPSAALHALRAESSALVEA